MRCILNTPSERVQAVLFKAISFPATYPKPFRLSIQVHSWAPIQVWWKTALDVGRRLLRRIGP